MKQITINGKNYNIKYSLRALFIFEQITNRPFEIKTLLDNYIFFYSMILASNKDKEPLDWDEFIDALDESPNLLVEMNDIISKQQKVDKLINRNDDNEDCEQKKS